ncbi:MAG: hypothetical protein KM310_08455 [Clostridiales bacterium]|nr:hypothetical protein [Clostridiales bacterium]
MNKLFKKLKEDEAGQSLWDYYLITLGLAATALLAVTDTGHTFLNWLLRVWDLFRNLFLWPEV